MKQPKIRCPYCGSQAMLRPASVVYGKRARPYQYVYVCSRYPECDAYVSAHNNRAHKPMGTLADKALRRKRAGAHASFNQLWESGKMEKWQAYKWLQAKYGLSSEQAHIAKFSADMCDRLVRDCQQIPFIVGGERHDTRTTEISHRTLIHSQIAGGP